MRGADKPGRVGLLPGEQCTKEQPSFRKGNYQINWLNAAVVLLPPVMLIYATLVLRVPLDARTFWVAVVAYFLNGWGITVGYHRMFSHRVCVAEPWVQALFLFLGAGAMQNSAKWWCRSHRIHHNYIDTDKDPYNAKRGFVFSHMGWILMKQDVSTLGYVDTHDLNTSRLVKLQHKYYVPIALFSGIGLWTLICGLGWGDWMGGYFYAAIAKICFVHQSTFFINSLAHSNFFGAKQNFSENHTSHDSWVCAILSLGEGYHNFHHEFAQDYRNGIKWYHWDPTKWIIRTLEIFGQVRQVVRTPNSVIERNVATVKRNQSQRALEVSKQQLADIDARHDVPETWSWEKFQERVRAGEKLLVVGHYVLDLQRPIPTGPGYTHKGRTMKWMQVHPGGSRLLEAYVGRDATAAMSGAVHAHSEGAFNLLQHLRVAHIDRHDIK
jgi:stearoyl-CoA desaturase (delta-9 desaturase)